eukprot:3040577-Amphidinium_carterae.2
MRALNGNITLWAANIGSLRTHWELLTEVPGDVLCLSETHITETMLKGGVGRVTAAGLKAFLSPSSCERSAGVGNIVKGSVQLQPLWRDTEGRACIAAVSKHGATLVLAVVYGVVNEPGQTEELLQTVASQLACFSDLPQVLVGDFNHGAGELPTTLLLSSIGWRLGHSASHPTCFVPNGEPSCIDYFMLSPVCSALV